MEASKEKTDSIPGKGPLYRSISAGDAEGTAIAVAYEILRAELMVNVLNNGPVSVVSNIPGAIQEFSSEMAERIGNYAQKILNEIRRESK